MLVGLLSWWYGDGFRYRIKIIKDRLSASADFFSIGLLINTLFNPFRQISAGRVEAGTLGDRFRGWLDRVISRFIGAFMRSIMILIGLVTMTLQGIFGAVVLVFWLVAPIMPAACLIAMVIGLVVPWKI
ncbi:MAG: hypothetical protein ACM3KH_00125 [Thiobacillus sp.]